jgi:hypothetical protein
MGAFRLLLTVTCLAAAHAGTADAADLDPLLETLLAVGPKGAGNAEASRAWEQLALADAEHLPTILRALDDAGPLAANWIRCAVDAIAERQLDSGGKLPEAKLEWFVRDTGHAPRARRLAYEWLVRADPTAPDRMIPGMLNDPSVEMRREAVARLIDQAAELAERGGPAEAVPRYRKALTSARDVDQIRLLAARLKDAGEDVHLPRHFGFVTRWKLIGPFDNTDEKGFATAYAPEKQVDLEAAHPGKHGQVKWIDCQSDHEYGRVDFNKAIGEEKNVVGYALTEFVAKREQEVDLRAASDNAVKLWLNGKLIGEHDVYHSGTQFDQYTSRGVLRPGRNLILVKVCQNDQPQDWARDWSFQLRVCDRTGGAILSADRKP